MKIAILAHAKINLALDIVGRTVDGYHELSGVMHTVTLNDIVTVESDDKITVKCNETLPENNTAVKAVNEYAKELGKSIGARIEIIKRIPSEAGLGGASADAAAVLKALNTIYGGVDESTLAKIAKRVGADVPFCLQGGCAIAEGIGERLKPLPTQQLYLVIAKNRVGISTQRLFFAYDSGNFGSFSGAKERVDNVISGCMTSSTSLIAANLYNSLEPVAISFIPNIQVLKDRLMSFGALGTLMTGSGSAVYGIFDSKLAADIAVDAMRDSGCEFVEQCNSI